MEKPISVLIKEWSVSNRYLLLPVKNGNEKIVLQVLRSGQMVREFNIELARNQAPDWWAFYEMTPFMGETLALVSVGTDLSADDRAWLEESVCQGDDLHGAKDLYHEKYRPQFHFSTRRGWHNDPNGLVFDGTLWHMYYQYNPFGVTWGNMHWGSTVSPDLLHWVEQPIALYQRSLQDMAFSGGGFIDWQNTAGCQQGDQPPLMVAFTSTGRGECLAYSNDQGKTLTEFPENPVIQHQGRDPKILWYEPGQKWVMIVYEEIGGELGYAIYDSHNLKQWNRLSFMPGFFECPELFELPVEGKPEEKYWVIHGCRWEKSRSTSLIGKFDGAHFTVLQENLHSHSGPHFYAAQVFSDAPEQRRIMIGWMAGPQFPDMPFS